MNIKYPLRCQLNIIALFHNAPGVFLVRIFNPDNRVNQNLQKVDFVVRKPLILLLNVKLRNEKELLLLALKLQIKLSSIFSKLNTINYNAKLNFLSCSLKLLFLISSTFDVILNNLFLVIFLNCFFINTTINIEININNFINIITFIKNIIVAMHDNFFRGLINHLHLFHGNYLQAMFLERIKLFSYYRDVCVC